MNVGTLARLISKLQMPARKKTTTATKAAPEVPVAMPAPTGGPAPGPATAEFDKEKHIVINSKVYEREAFSEEQVAAISAVNYADQQIASTEQDLKIYIDIGYRVKTIISVEYFCNKLQTKIC